MNILFEDNHLIVVEKPRGISVQSDRPEGRSLQTMLQQYIKIKHQKPRNVYLGIVHRLDKPVPGVMVFARTSKAASRLSQQFREHTVKKIYTAIVHGSLSKSTGTLRHYIHKNPGTRKVLISDTPQAGYKEAILSYTVTKTSKESSMLSIELLTGRPHQIRAQLHAIGHPIIGDTLYGSNEKDKSVQLTATSLTFHHPITKEQLTFEINHLE